ncbi:hypothetical protein KI387_007568, partial [Taxus chinensis]
MVDVASAIEVIDVEVIMGIGHSCEMTGGKVEVGSVEPDGADAGVGTRAEGNKYGHVVYQLTRGIS